MNYYLLIIPIALCFMFARWLFLGHKADKEEHLTFDDLANKQDNYNRDYDDNLE